MKKRLPVFPSVILLALFCFSIFQTNTVKGQMLYGITSYGGSSNLGTIFHYNQATGSQILDYSLPVLNPGANPAYTDLTDGGNGKFYGMTYLGGINNAGVIFEWDPATNVYTKKIDLSVSSGSNPSGSLTLNGGKFYGMTYNGGSNNVGVIFEWDPTTNVYTKKIDLSFSIGSNPAGSLTLGGGKFYAMTVQGGANGVGVIFEWDPSSNAYTKKIDLSSSTGGVPFGSLTFSGGKFYGMTNGGGLNSSGVIFEWDPVTNTYTKEIDLSSSIGSYPRGTLALSGGKFYGMTLQGGLNNAGVIFEWDPATNSYSKKIDLSSSIGSYPRGLLVFSNGKFYGMTNQGGVNGLGVIFEWDPATNSYTKKIDLNSTIGIGGQPDGSLTLRGGKLYGMTQFGGSNNAGVIFEWDPSANVYTKKIDFNITTGSYPQGSLTQSGAKLFGMATQGGSNNGGVIFEWDIATNTYTKKIDLSTSAGYSPYGSLTLSWGKFYGMTYYGGSNNVGVIFEWDPATNAYTKKNDLSSSTGSSPFGSLTLSGGKFYGMTHNGGSNNVGTIFEWDPVTNAYTKKIDLSNSIGSNPFGSLTINGGKFYGMTVSGGSNSVGVIFEWDPVNNIYTKKIDLSTSTGSSPRGSLTLSGGKFYGMTYGGGSNNVGVIFEWDPATNIYSKKIDLSVANGDLPSGSMTFSGGKFYGMTAYGGLNGAGVIFEWDPVTNTYTKKTDLSIANGSNPMTTQFIVYDPPCVNPNTAGTIAGNQTGCSGFDPSLIISTALPSGENGTIEYKWKSSISPFSTWTDIGSSDTTAYDPPTGLLVTTWYKRFARVDCMTDWTGAAESNIATVNVNPLPTVDAGAVVSPIDQGGTTAALGGSIGGGATAAIWSDNGAGGTFSNNNGSTPATTTYTASASSASTVTLTLTSSGGSCGSVSDSKQLTVNAVSTSQVQLWGLTSQGGIDGKGTLFHYAVSTNTQVVDHSFSADAIGEHPYTELIDGGNGKFYGMTQSGGINFQGVIFEWDPVNNIYSPKVYFDDPTNGRWPVGSLNLYNGKFYGMTNGGGTNDLGVIFVWDPVTNIYTKKIDFDGTNTGGTPWGSLIIIGGKFYGMTSSGGANSKGVIFEWNPATNLLTKKIDFNGTAIGSSPRGSLAVFNSKLYGMTVIGGASNRGVIFEWDPATNNFVKKVDFVGTSTGQNPNGTLKLSGGKFYGLTRAGGASSGGVIFEWDPSTNTYTKKIDLGGTNGSNPYGYLTENGGKFYGVTSAGGIQYGIIFEWDPVTNIYTKKIDFDNSAKGATPFGSLTFLSGKFYGMTYEGGINNMGVVFEWNPSTNAFTKKIDFINTVSGNTPFGSLTQYSGKFYGMSLQGGANNQGVIFEMDPTTSTYTKKIDFDGSNGSSPSGSLSLYGSKFYGITQLGGANNNGVIFEWDPSSNLYVKKLEFNDATTGISVGSLLLKGGKFYGCTNSFGVNNFYGAIFEWDPATNVFTKKIDFNGTNGASPTGYLAEHGGKLYGMTVDGGAYNYGVIFEWDPANNVYTKKLDLNTYGVTPFGGLILKGSKFYGMTNQGGSNNAGVIFEWDPSTNIYTNKISFTGTNGSYPYGSLTLSNGKFYGLTYSGGANNKGVLFEWEPLSNTLTKKIDFNGTNGSSPRYTTLLEYTPATYWTGLTNTNWGTNTNWSTNLVPDAATDVVIPDVPRMVVVNESPSTPAVCNNLTIQAGNMVLINPGKALTVNSTLANNNGTLGLDIDQGASLITKGVVNGSANVIVNIDGGEWHLISSPVSDAVSGMFTGKYLQQHTQSTNAYTDIPATNFPLTPMKGFALYGTSVFTAFYIGYLNTGVVGSSANISRSESGPNSGWNLVGNPYPSPIDWDAASGWTKTNVNNSTYIHVNSATWATYVGAVGNTPGTGANGGSRYIASTQGFFVNVNDDGSTSGTLAMDNLVRVHNATTFFKSAEADLVRLKVSGNGYTDEAVLRFLQEATPEFDGDYDAYKFFGDVAEAPQIYTMGSIPLSINSMPETKTVVVGVHIGVAGVYSMAAPQANNLSSISLEDTKTGIFTDFHDGPYSFSFTPGENEKRFVLHFDLLSVPGSEKELIQIYSSNRTVYINFPENGNGEAYIYNTNGQLMSTSSVAKGINSLNLSAAGIYMVKVVTRNSTIVKKVLITK